MYKRRSGRQECFIALNISSEPRRIDWGGQGTLMLSTYLDKEDSPVNNPLIVRGDEGVIVKAL